jgi:hypothetical protein
MPTILFDLKWLYIDETNQDKENEVGILCNIDFIAPIYSIFYSSYTYRVKWIKYLLVYYFSIRYKYYKKIKLIYIVYYLIFNLIEFIKDLLIKDLNNYIFLKVLYIIIMIINYNI